MWQLWCTARTLLYLNCTEKCKLTLEVWHTYYEGLVGQHCGVHMSTACGECGMFLAKAWQPCVGWPSQCIRICVQIGVALLQAIYVGKLLFFHDARTVRVRLACNVACCHPCAFTSVAVRMLTCHHQMGCSGDSILISGVGGQYLNILWSQLRPSVVL